MRKADAFLILIYGLINYLQGAEVEPKESSFLVQEKNIPEFRRLRDLLGLPVGDAKTAKATHGKKRTTKFTPKCPKNIRDIPPEAREIVLKKCPTVRDKEYKKQEKKVADIIMNSKKRVKISYQQQKKALILAVNHLARLAGPLPSI